MGVEIFPLVFHTPNILFLLWQTLQMVLIHLYYYIYYYSLYNGEFMFFDSFPLQLFMYWGRDFPAFFPWGSFAIPVSCVSLCLSYTESKMCESVVQRITNTIKHYHERLRVMPYVPVTSFHRDSLEYCGDANKIFLTFLLCGHAICLQCLKDVGIIRSKVLCVSWYDLMRRSFSYKMFPVAIPLSIIFRLEKFGRIFL